MKTAPDPANGPKKSAHVPNAAKDTAGGGDTAPVFAESFAPRRGWFIGLLIVLAIWLGYLAYLKFAATRAGAPDPSATPAPAAAQGAAPLTAAGP